MYLLVFTCSLLATVVLGAIAYRRTSQRSTLDRCLAACFPPVALLVLLLVIRYSFYELFTEWNAARLAPVVALRYGYDLYYGPDQGPALCTIYPPMWAAAYLPATAGKTPNQVLLIAGAIAAGFYFAPILLFHCCPARRGFEITLFPLLSLACLALYTFESPPLRMSALWTHADAPALGFGAAACAWIYRYRESFRLPCFLASSLCAVLSVLSKQTMVPILFALPLWIAITEGRRAAMQYLATLAVSIAAASVVVLLLFNLRDLFFNLILVPAQHPWKDRSIDGFVTAYGELARYYLPLALLLGFAVTAGAVFTQTRPFRLSNYLRVNPWILPLLVGLLTLPTSFLGRIKVGGNLNSLSFTLYFFAVAAHLLLVAAMSEGAPLGRPSVQKAAKTLVLVVLAGMLTLQLPELLLVLRDFQGIANNQQQQAFEHLKNHPGESYLPWHPLAHLLAEGKLYHFEWGLIDRDMAGVPVSGAHFWAHVPPNARRLCFPPTRQANEALKHMPQFRQPDSHPSLPGWHCLRRP